jgi:hypothetical protein
MLKFHDQIFGIQFVMDLKKLYKNTCPVKDKSNGLNTNVTPGLHFWPAPLQAFALVVNPRLGLRKCLCGVLGLLISFVML